MGGSAYKGICRECADEANVWETIRRVERWTEIRGRRRVAQILVIHADHAVEGRPQAKVMRERHRYWVAAWELMNDRAALRKVVEHRLVTPGIDLVPVPDADLPGVAGAL